MKAIVSEKGQVVIPKQLRDKLGIGPGERLEFTAEGGRLIARKIIERDPVDVVFGILDIDSSVDDLVAEMRGGNDDHRD